MKTNIMAASTVTSKGRVTIPKEIRDFMGLHTGGRIHFLQEEDGKVTMLPVVQHITSLKGLASKSHKTASVEDMNQAIRTRKHQ